MNLFERSRTGDRALFGTLPMWWIYTQHSQPLGDKELEDIWKT